SFGQVPYFILLGAAGGFISLYYTHAAWQLKTFFGNFKNRYARALTGGIALGIMVFCFPRLYGEGYVGVRSLFSESGSELLPPLLQQFPYEPFYLLLVVLALLVLLKPI